MSDTRPRSVFVQEYLDWLEDREDTASSAEADLAGPWKVEPCEGGFAVLRQWESLAAGHQPEGVFRQREIALLAAAVLPLIGQEPRLHLGADEGPGGFPLQALSAAEGLIEAGRLKTYNTELVRGLNLVGGLLRNPVSLSQQLEAAGSTAQERTGELLAARLADARP